MFILVRFLISEKSQKSYSFKFIELRTIKICMTLNLIIGKTFMSRYWCVVILLKSGDRSVSHLLTCSLQVVENSSQPPDHGYVFIHDKCKFYIYFSVSLQRFKLVICVPLESDHEIFVSEKISPLRPFGQAT